MAEGMHKGGHLLFVLGVLAIVWGITQWFMVGLMWPAYGAWIVGGAILVVVAWAKKSWISK